MKVYETFIEVNLAFIYLLFPFYVGFCVVAQGVFNRRIAAEWGLTWAVFLTGVLFLVVSVALLLATKYVPQMLPENLRTDTFSLKTLRWWYVIPTICGFSIVLGIPWSLELNGAAKTFVLLIVSQILLGLLADYFVYDAIVSSKKVIGAVIVMIGAIIVTVSP